MEELFTITVTALYGFNGLDHAVIISSLMQELLTAGILDAAVTLSSTDVSFTGQIEALHVLEAVQRGTTCMLLIGLTPISILAEPCKEEEYDRNTLTTIAV